MRNRRPIATNMTYTLIILNGLVFLAEQSNADRLISLFALWPISGPAADVPDFHLWQLVTYSLLHANSMHLIFNMIGLYMFGRDVERTIGVIYMGILYLSSVVAGGIVQLIVTAVTAQIYPTLGASAGVFGLLTSYAVLFPKRRVLLLFPPIPMPAWLFATGYAVLELLLGVSGSEGGVAHFAHLGGVFGALALMFHWSKISRRRQFD